MTARKNKSTTVKKDTARKRVASRSKTTVCLVAPLAYALFNPQSKIVFGGAEVQLFQLANQLAKNPRYDVNVLVATDGAIGTERYGAVTVHCAYTLRKSATNYLRSPLRIYRTLKRVRPAIVIQRGAGAETGICAAYCTRNRSALIFSIAHEIDVNGTYAKRGVFGKLYTYGLDRARHIIVQNEDQRGMLTTWRKPRVPMTLIKTGYPIRPVKAKDKRGVLWVARSDSWKRPEVFIELARAYPQVPFTMVMPKSADTATWERTHALAKGVANLELIEHVPFAEIQGRFDRAAVFVNTSINEGFPNTFVQSWLGSTPVVSLKVNPDGILERTRGGYGCDDDKKLFITKVGAILKDQSLATRLGKNGLTHVAKDHDITKTAKQWSAVIDSLSASEGTPRRSP